MRIRLEPQFVNIGFLGSTSRRGRDPVPHERGRGLFSSPGSALTYSIDFTLIALLRSRLVAQRWFFRSWAQVTAILGSSRAIDAGGLDTGRQPSFDHTSRCNELPVGDLPVVAVVTRFTVAGIQDGLLVFQSGWRVRRLQPLRSFRGKSCTCWSGTPLWVENFLPRPHTWSHRSRCIDSSGSGSSC